MFVDEVKFRSFLKDASTNYLGNSLDFNNWFDNQLLVIYELFVKNNVQQLGKFKIQKATMPPHNCFYRMLEEPPFFKYPEILNHRLVTIN